MEDLKAYRDRWKGQTVTMVGASVTTVDYAELAANGTENTVLVNWAVRIAPLFRKPRRAYFLTWHMNVFHELPELHAPQLTSIVHKYEQYLLPAELLERCVNYEAVNILPHEAYTHALKLWSKRGQDFIDQTNQLISCANSTLLALLFIWHTGCREINAVGMHDIGGIPAGHYDPRLKAQTEHVHTHTYERDLKVFCKAMGISINYLGDL